LTALMPVHLIALFHKPSPAVILFCSLLRPNA
jgi:hypothetical protein